MVSSRLTSEGVAFALTAAGSKKTDYFPPQRHGNPAISEIQELKKGETRGFPSPSHERFGFFNQQHAVITANVKVDFRGWELGKTLYILLIYSLDFIMLRAIR